MYYYFRIVGGLRTQADKTLCVEVIFFIGLTKQLQKKLQALQAFGLTHPSSGKGETEVVKGSPR